MRLNKHSSIKRRPMHETQRAPAIPQPGMEEYRFPGSPDFASGCRDGVDSLREIQQSLFYSKLLHESYTLTLRQARNKLSELKSALSEAYFNECSMLASMHYKVREQEEGAPAHVSQVAWVVGSDTKKKMLYPGLHHNRRNTSLGFTPPQYSSPHHRSSQMSPLPPPLARHGTGFLSVPNTNGGISSGMNTNENLQQLVSSLREFPEVIGPTLGTPFGNFVEDHPEDLRPWALARVIIGEICGYRPVAGDTCVAGEKSALALLSSIPAPLPRLSGDDAFDDTYGDLSERDPEIAAAVMQEFCRRCAGRWLEITLGSFVQKLARKNQGARPKPGGSHDRSTQHLLPALSRLVQKLLRAIPGIPDGIVQLGWLVHRLKTRPRKRSRMPCPSETKVSNTSFKQPILFVHSSTLRLRESGNDGTCEDKEKKERSLPPPWSFIFGELIPFALRGAESLGLSGHIPVSPLVQSDLDKLANLICRIAGDEYLPQTPITAPRASHPVPTHLHSYPPSYHVNGNSGLRRGSPNRQMLDSHGDSDWTDISGTLSSFLTPMRQSLRQYLANLTNIKGGQGGLRVGERASGDVVRDSWEMTPRSPRRIWKEQKNSMSDEMKNLKDFPTTPILISQHDMYLLHLLLFNHYNRGFGYGTGPRFSEALPKEVSAALGVCGDPIHPSERERVSKYGSWLPNWISPTNTYGMVANFDTTAYDDLAYSPRRSRDNFVKPPIFTLMPDITGFSPPRINLKESLRKSRGDGNPGSRLLAKAVETLSMILSGLPTIRSGGTLNQLYHELRANDSIGPSIALRGSVTSVRDALEASAEDTKNPGAHGLSSEDASLSTDPRTSVCRPCVLYPVSCASPERLPRWLVERILDIHHEWQELMRSGIQELVTFDAKVAKMTANTRARASSCERYMTLSASRSSLVRSHALVPGFLGALAAVPSPSCARGSPGDLSEISKTPAEGELRDSEVVDQGGRETTSEGNVAKGAADFVNADGTGASRKVDKKTLRGLSGDGNAFLCPDCQGRMRTFGEVLQQFARSVASDEGSFHEDHTSSGNHLSPRRVRLKKRSRSHGELPTEHLTSSDMSEVYIRDYLVSEAVDILFCGCPKVTNRVREIAQRLPSDSKALWNLQESLRQSPIETEGEGRAKFGLKSGVCKDFQGEESLISKRKEIFKQSKTIKTLEDDDNRWPMRAVVESRSEQRVVRSVELELSAMTQASSIVTKMRCLKKVDRILKMALNTGVLGYELHERWYCIFLTLAIKNTGAYTIASNLSGLRLFYPNADKSPGFSSIFSAVQSMIALSNAKAVPSPHKANRETLSRPTASSQRSQKMFRDAKQENCTPSKLPEDPQDNQTGILDSPQRSATHPPPPRLLVSPCDSRKGCQTSAEDGADAANSCSRSDDGGSSMGYGKTDDEDPEDAGNNVDILCPKTPVTPLRPSSTRNRYGSGMIPRRTSRPRISEAKILPGSGSGSGPKGEGEGMNTSKSNLTWNECISSQSSLLSYPPVDAISG